VKVIESVSEMKEYVKQAKSESKTIGLVPTMGYLHDGHKSLIKKSSSENDITVVSVFVNPTQFGINEDLEKYPRDLEHDMKVAEEGGGTIIFHPAPMEMYPSEYNTYVNVENITTILCGRTRPTHFRGVATIVTKLFNIVSPDRAYFGQKDAQQLAVIYRMVEDMNMDVDIVACPIVRESDGLAMSSRNTYLSEEERKQARILSQSLKQAENLYHNGEKNVHIIINDIRALIQTMPLAMIEYVEAVEFPSMKECFEIKGKTLIALAVKFGTTRLIDNIIIG